MVINEKKEKKTFKTKSFMMKTLQIEGYHYFFDKAEDIIFLQTRLLELSQINIHIVSPTLFKCELFKPGIAEED